MKKTDIQKKIEIPAEGVKLRGVIHLPPDTTSLILFAHGSGSSHLSPRNKSVAASLNEEGFGTLLFDLLTFEEEKEDMISRELRFNIPFLAYRLLQATCWAEEQYALRMGYFGASTGAAAAIHAAAELGEKVKALVSRGGRPDLAGQALTRLKTPTLLIVGGEDHGVIELNERAYEMISSTKKLQLIEGATHLFEESGALEEVARLAHIWFAKYL